LLCTYSRRSARNYIIYRLGSYTCAPRFVVVMRVVTATLGDSVVERTHTTIVIIIIIYEREKMYRLFTGVLHIGVTTVEGGSGGSLAP